MPELHPESDGTTRDPKVRRISNKVPHKPQEKPEPKAAKPEHTAKRADDAKEPEASAPDPKRPNRRRRGKGKAQGKDSSRETEFVASAADESEAAPPPAAAEPQEKAPQPRPPQPPRRKLDAEQVAKNAWKIYLSEVSEEGVALIGDTDARELARRCFRLSEIFMEEEGRRN